MEGLYWIHMSAWYLLSQRHFKCIVSVGGRCVSILIVFFLAEIEKNSVAMRITIFFTKEINIILMENVMTG